jgi:hypothetical protein
MEPATGPILYQMNPVHTQILQRQMHENKIVLPKSRSRSQQNIDLLIPCWLVGPIAQIRNDNTWVWKVAAMMDVRRRPKFRSSGRKPATVPLYPTQMLHGLCGTEPPTIAMRNRCLFPVSAGRRRSSTFKDAAPVSLQMLFTQFMIIFPPHHMLLQFSRL